MPQPNILISDGLDESGQAILRASAKVDDKSGISPEDLQKIIGKYDALIAPARPTVAYPLDRDFDKAYPGVGGGPAIIPAGNAVGQPAICIPNGFGPDNLPTGIQFTGRVWSEARLLAIAHEYQKVTDWHKKRPPLIAEAVQEKKP